MSNGPAEILLCRVTFEDKYLLKQKKKKGNDNEPFERST